MIGSGQETLPNGACSMSLPRTAADVLENHTTLEVESLDRIYLKVIQMRLQERRGIAWYFRKHRGEVFATAKVMAEMTRPFVSSIEKFALTNAIPLMTFTKGQRKDNMAQQSLAGFPNREGILFIGKAQEKAYVCRTITKKNEQTGRDYPWLMKSTAMVNHYYFYCVDEDFGPFFIKFCSYFPYDARLCLNGHEYAKRQLEKRGIKYEPLDNGILSCEDPKLLQKICDELTEAKIEKLLRKWLARLPHPFPAKDRAAGFRYEIFMQQVEFARTLVLDKPVSGRIFFEEMLRENLDLGRPTQMQLIFDKRIPRTTKTRFRTRLITEHVIPSLWLDYKRSSIKQYFKMGRALRTELTVNHTRDFGIGKALHNLPELRAVAFAANRRLLHVQKLSHDPMLGDEEFQSLTSPQEVDGQRVSGLKFADPMVLAVLTALLMFRFLPRGFRNGDLRRDVSQLLARPAHDLSPGQMTYQLRRLRLRGLIKRIPGTQRYEVTDSGQRMALFWLGSLSQTIRPLATTVSDVTRQGQILNTLRKTLQKYSNTSSVSKT
jgi:DNA-binding PadR family transcriptional regulator